jgi:hypothetical protein
VKGNTEVLTNFKGVNLQQKSLLREGELVDAQNVVIGDQGSVKKRPGINIKSAHQGISSVPGKSFIILGYANSATASTMVFVSNGTNVYGYYPDPSTEVLTLGPSSAVDDIETAVQFENKAYIFSSTGRPTVYTSTGATTGTFVDVGFQLIKQLSATTVAGNTVTVGAGNTSVFTVNEKVDVRVMSTGAIAVGLQNREITNIDTITGVLTLSGAPGTGPTDTTMGVYKARGNLESFNASATFSIVHKDRIFYFNNKDTSASPGPYTSRLYFTELWADANFDTPAAYNPLNYIDVDPGNGDFLVAAATLNDQLVLFKRFSTWILYTDGPDSGWTLRKAHATVGCTGRDTPFVIQNFLYFLAGDGVYRTDGTTFEHLSNPVDPGMIGVNIAFTPDACNRAAAVRWKDWYIVRKNYTADTLAYVYGWKTRTWTLWDMPSYSGPMINIYSNTATTGSGESGNIYPSEIGGGGASVSSAAMSALLYFDYKYGGPSNNKAYFWELNQYHTSDGNVATGAANGVAIPFQIETMLFDFGTPYDWKRIHTVMVDTDPSNSAGSRTLTLTYKRDGKTPYTATQAAQADEYRAMWRFKGPGRCRWLGVKVYGESDDNFEINSLGFVKAPDGLVGRSMTGSVS